MHPNEETRMPVVAPAPRLYRAREVAHILGVSTKRVRELVDSGQLRSVRLGAEGGGWHRIPADEVERLIAGEDRAP
jgi:excisionase family DNA binding protein